MFKIDRERIKNNINMSELLDNVLDIVEGKENNRMNENGNKDSRTIMTKKELVSNELAERIGLEMLPPKVKQAHIDGDIYFHDLGYSPLYSYYNCMVINVEEMFDNGFKLGNCDITPPKSFKVFINLLTQVVAHVSSLIYGGCTLSDIDVVGEKYVTRSYDGYLKQALNWTDDIEKAKNIAEDLTNKEIEEATKTLEYNLNSLYTSSAQTPFVTISFGQSTTWQGRAIQKGILQQRINGLGRSRKTAVFPKLVYILSKGVNVKPHDPNYDIKQLALECSSKRIYPDILNKEKCIEVTGHYCTSRGCRSFSLGEYLVDGKDLISRQCGGVVTINLPMLAVKSNGDVEKFNTLLDETLQIAHEGLLFRISRFDGVKASSAPILYEYGALGVRMKPDDEIQDLFKNGRASLSLGYIGLEECSYYLTKNRRYESRETKKLSIEILKHLRESCEAWKREDGYSFGLYGTPSEGYCKKALDKIKDKFGIIEGVTDKEYIINSFHTPPTQQVNAFDRIDFEKEYIQQSKAGNIIYVELPNLRNNLKALETIWDYAYENVMYFGTNQPADLCMKCEYEGELIPTDEGYVCPKCGNKDQTKLVAIRRISGYLAENSARPVNRGKQAEFNDRVKNI